MDENPTTLTDEQYRQNCSGLTVAQLIKELRRVEAEEKSGRWVLSVENSLRQRATFLKDEIISRIERTKRGK